MYIANIGSVKTNIDRISTAQTTDYEKSRRELIEAKLYYLRDTNTQAEFDYVVDGEMRQGEQKEFGMPAKELVKRMKSIVNKILKMKQNTPTIWELFNLSTSDETTQKLTQPAAIVAETRQRSNINPQALNVAKVAWNHR